MTWHDALLWVLVTFALRAFGANLAWFGRTGPGVHSGSALARAVARLATPDTVSALRVAYLLGVPVAAIAARVVTPSAMGLAAPKSAMAILQSAALAVLALALLAAVWWPRRRRGDDPRSQPGAAPTASLALSAALRESHWAFLRAAMLTVMPARPAVAVTVALALAAAEAWSDPDRRSRLRLPSTAATSSWIAAAAIVSGYAFVTTGSSVLAWVLQVALGWALAVAFPERLRETADTVAGASAAPEPTVI